MDLEVGPGLTIPESELQWRFSRSSGAGGQHVNTSDSRVQLTWDVAGSSAVTEEQRTRILERTGRRTAAAGAITVTVSARRSQLRNREAALDALRELLREALAPPAPARRPTRPTRGSQRRRLAGKQQRSATKQQRRRPSDD
ncbi:alternative ribosome rescue aminoacyl-tRNA hydrolase ArfB [Curtobacterium sp. APC 4022]|uniref:alternative ribosome rescue aminoacyl-tRNA hydrolase ArfB n=1 Tax=Curtobacterium sp. APC 4022 TaxID=3035201 RepID=UPI0025B2DD6F|nr:alternative ribosome rescue aminoacyl-tRNA hydrolase ArfB [Curtobacterium sp. APC 4022]MDN3478953.1 alternative ribosome rescue aminoacyl-tRNA hydrolase ArfB [Curtobacterium sp. APC 4022]